MTISRREADERLERFRRACRERGVRLTHQRLEILREVAQSSDHPDAVRVFRDVRSRITTLSRDTVYRALWLLADLGLVTTLGPPQGRTRFDANLSRHHHFVCRRCGSTRDFFSDDLADLPLPPSVRALGRVESTHVEARGVCSECSSDY